MQVVSLAEARNNLKAVFDSVYIDHEDVVMISMDEYLNWQNQDKRILKKINSLIKDIKRDPHLKLIRS